MTAVAVRSLGSIQPARAKFVPAEPNTNNELGRLMAQVQDDDHKAVVAVLSYRMDAVEKKVDRVLELVEGKSDGEEARVIPVGTATQGATTLGLAIIDLLKTQPIITLLLVILLGTLGASGIIHIIESVQKLGG